MKWIKRIGFFILTNLLVMTMVSIVWNILVSVFGVKLLGGNYTGLAVMSALVGMAGSLISLFLSKWMVKRSLDIQIIDAATTDPRQHSLLTTVHALAKRAGLEVMPEVGIYYSDDVNAFATGPTRDNSLVAVSSGLLNVMNEDEVVGVLGHEISHVANGDMVTMTLIQGVVNAFVFFFSRVVAGFIASGVEERSRWMVRFLATLVCDLAFTLLGSFVVAYFSRWREFRADAGSANITSKNNMIAALRRLQLIQGRSEPTDDNTGRDPLAAMKISSSSGGGFLALMSTHPNLDDRIRALEALR